MTATDTFDIFSSIDGFGSYGPLATGCARPDSVQVLAETLVAQRLHDAGTAATLRVIDAGHMVHLDKPGAWSSAVTDFLGA